MTETTTTEPDETASTEHHTAPESDRDESPETVVPWRTNPRELLDPVVDSIEIVERGEWKVTASGAVYRDVMVGGLYMEGFRIGAIEHADGDTFRFEVIENYDLEDQERYCTANEQANTGVSDE